MSTSGTGLDGLADEGLLADLRRVLVAADPVPDGLVARARFAVELEDPHVAVARWEAVDALVGVRSTTGTPGTVTYTVEGLSVMVAVSGGGGDPLRFDGWLAPPAPDEVEVRVQGHPAASTRADEGGRFVVDGVPSGTVQLLVRQSLPDGTVRTVVAPALRL